MRPLPSFLTILSPIPLSALALTVSTPPSAVTCLAGLVLLLTARIGCPPPPSPTLSLTPLPPSLLTPSLRLMLRGNSAFLILPPPHESQSISSFLAPSTMWFLSLPSCPNHLGFGFDQTWPFSAPLSCTPSPSPSPSSPFLSDLSLSLLLVPRCTASLSSSHPPALPPSRPPSPASPYPR